MRESSPRQRHGNADEQDNTHYADRSFDIEQSAAPRRAQPSTSVMYAIGMFDNEACRLYLVAAAPADRFEHHRREERPVVPGSTRTSA
jgi:hypothetical protein